MELDHGKSLQVLAEQRHWTQHGRAYSLWAGSQGPGQRLEVETVSTEVVR